jgi:hypothetical protein
MKAIVKRPPQSRLSCGSGAAPQRHVTVVSTISSQPPMIADELRREADAFTDLVELKSKIARDSAGLSLTHIPKLLPLPWTEHRRLLG